MIAMSASDIEQLIEQFERELRARPNYARNLLGLAEAVAHKGHKHHAFELGQRAVAVAAGDPEIAARARHLFNNVIDLYHVALTNDRKRAAAWDRALKRAVRPGAHVLEIGTGSGILALRAARAGAGKVTTCEKNPILATIAREVIARNGYGDHIRVVNKRSQDLVAGRDFQDPVGLLFCDIFAEDLLSLEPLAILSDARRRLIAPETCVVPRSGAIVAALGMWRDYAHSGHIGDVDGFDLTPLSIFVQPSFSAPASQLTRLSEEHEIFRFDFTTPAYPAEGRTEFALTADRDGPVNGIVQWIRLDLGEDIVLENWSEAGEPNYWMSPLFWPLPRPIQLAKGAQRRFGGAHDGRRLTIWPLDPA